MQPLGPAAGPPAGPLGAGERLAAPDVARGLALLGIALANVVVLLWGRPVGPGVRPVDGNAADRAVDLLVAVLVDNRAYPLFALLLGYGVGVVLARQAAAGSPWPVARRVLVRRGLVLVVLGVAHGLLLFFGDILLQYGLLVLLLVLVVRLGDRPLRVLAALALVPVAVVSGFDGVSSGPVPTGGSGCVDPSTVWLGVADRACALGLGMLSAPLLVPSLLAPALVGLLLARRGVLADPAARPLLRRLAVVGLTVSTLGALPFALVVAGLVAAPAAVDVALAVLHGVTGVAGGVGAVALVALAVARPPRLPAVRGALAATGERSLSAYLAQSVVLVPLLAPWGAGLGDDLGTAAASALAAATWLPTAAAASLLARSGRRGPAESLTRRLTYPR